MRKPQHVLEVFLKPGEIYFGDENTRIRTLLGSCVAITMWHPARRVGGMCHYMLPKSRGSACSRQLDGRYADQAIAFLLQEIEQIGSSPVEFEVKMFGGGTQFEPLTAKRITVPVRNIGAGQELLKRHGFSVKTRHLGGLGRRNVVFDIWSGTVWVRHVQEIL